mmetsp:Transcript_103932/g.291078  ORF Transcript_103932/g.291078 Transcript_103932/m.291078 type:complete len:223 (+) Transcript_103932:124-792(+)
MLQHLRNEIETRTAWWCEKHPYAFPFSHTSTFSDVIFLFIFAFLSRRTALIIFIFSVGFLLLLLLSIGVRGSVSSRGRRSLKLANTRVFVIVRFKLVGFIPVESCPHTLEEDLARPVARATSRGAFLGCLLPLELVHRLSNVCWAETTLGSDVFQNGLACSGLSQRANGVRVVPTKTWLSPTVLAGHSSEADFAVLIAADAIRLGELARFHLRHGDKESIGH